MPRLPSAATLAVLYMHAAPADALRPARYAAQRCHSCSTIHAWRPRRRAAPRTMRCPWWALLNSCSQCHGEQLPVVL